MKKKNGKLTRALPIGIAVSVLGVAVFIFLFFFLDVIKTPEDTSGIHTQTPPGHKTIEITATPDVPPDPVPAPAPIPPDIAAYNTYLTGPEYIPVFKEESDIYEGYLLLVNAEYSYDIPDNLELVTIAGAKTQLYSVYPSSLRLQKQIMEYLNEMVQGFYDATDKTYLRVISAFRDEAYQRRVLNQYINQIGREAALKRVALPGHSEHHTGLAVDFGVYINGVQYLFQNYDSTRWFYVNSYKYGFILRYPNGKTSITNTMYEPWHYRYTGLPHSYIMYNNNWVLEEYIAGIKKYTEAEPMTVIYDGIAYEVYYTDNMEINIPVQAEYTISGNNIDGFIVTIFNRYDRLTNIAIE